MQIKRLLYIYIYMHNFGLENISTQIKANKGKYI